MLVYCKLFIMAKIDIIVNRTLLALWKTRTLAPDQRARIAEEQQDRDEKPILLEDTGSYLIVQDEKMSKVLSVEIPLSVSSSLFTFICRILFWHFAHISIINILIE